MAGGRDFFHFFAIFFCGGLRATPCVQTRLALSRTGVARDAKWGGSGARAAGVGVAAGRRKVLAGKELCGASRWAEGRRAAQERGAKMGRRNKDVQIACDYQRW